MFARINGCTFETKLCSQGLTFMVSSQLVIFIYVHELCLRGIYFRDLEMIAKFAK